MSTSPSKINFKMYQGSTFSEVIRWESSKKIYKTITDITKAAPCVITSTGHEVPDGWRIKVTNVVGMTQINDNENYYTATVLTSDTIELNEVNSLAYTAYASGGVIEYNEPINLVGYEARMQLRASVSDSTVIAEFTTDNGGIIIDTAAYTITIIDSAVSTATYTFSNAVYSLELVSTSDGVVTPLATGTITLVKEVTR